MGLVFRAGASVLRAWSHSGGVASRAGDRDRSRAAARLAALGTEPDPRFTFANERTFLAWNRTALALIAGGVAVTHLLDLRYWQAIVIGVPLIGLGGLMSLWSYTRWEANERCLRLGRPLPYTGALKSLSLAVAAICVVTAVVLIVGGTP